MNTDIPTTRIFNETAICNSCKQLIFGYTHWCGPTFLLCHQCSCQQLTPEAHYEQTGIMNSKYKKQKLIKLLKGK